MKIILTGCTGRVGAAVLQECINNPAVTTIVALTRRPLDSIVNSSKLTNIILTREQFLEPVSVQTQLHGADACVWALGVPTGATREAELEYPLAFAKIAPQLRTDTTKPFRFVFTSGAGIKYFPAKETDSTWFLGDLRKNKTAAIDQLQQLSGGSNNALQVIVVRPGLVVRRDTLSSWIPGTITFDRLSAAMVAYGFKGPSNGQSFDFVDNGILAKDGQALLSDRQSR
ncbi:hypothetical protein BKA62DRAFT_649428 [Auriculariales sp. MPI-PUGE-AT-0066]|nr:hypothetical protein BKA62DRAFT_649428 [Auriculariales sp. MPI-PUGE-AT-0066]